MTVADFDREIECFRDLANGAVSTAIKNVYITFMNDSIERRNWFIADMLNYSAKQRQSLENDHNIIREENKKILAGHFELHKLIHACSSIEGGLNRMISWAEKLDIPEDFELMEQECCDEDYLPAVS